VAAAALRRRILSGLVRPGTALREEHLSHELRVSRNTLREAFKLLRAEGLVVQVPNRGTQVRALTASDVDDILTARRVLEPEAAARLSLHPAKAEPLEDLARQIGLAARRGDVRGYFLADRSFHAELTWLAFGSRRLRQTIERCMDELTVAFAYFDRQALQAGNVADPEREHAELLAPILAGGQAASRRRMEEHLDRAAAALRGTAHPSSDGRARSDETSTRAMESP
jgi:DNA-binding GntR family transcriptional regulator